MLRCVLPTSLLAPDGWVHHPFCWVFHQDGTAWILEHVGDGSASRRISFELWRLLRRWLTASVVVPGDPLRASINYPFHRQAPCLRKQYVCFLLASDRPSRGLGVVLPGK